MFAMEMVGRDQIGPGQCFLLPCGFSQKINSSRRGENQIFLMSFFKMRDNLPFSGPGHQSPGCGLGTAGFVTVAPGSRLSHITDSPGFPPADQAF